MKHKFVNNKLRIIFNELPEHLFCKQVLGMDENKALFARVDRVEEVDEEGRVIIHPVVDLYRFKPRKIYDPTNGEVSSLEEEHDEPHRRLEPMFEEEEKVTKI